MNKRNFLKLLSFTPFIPIAAKAEFRLSDHKEVISPEQLDNPAIDLATECRLAMTHRVTVVDAEKRGILIPN